MGITERVPQPAAGPQVSVPCPACGAPFTWPPVGRCTRCGADLAGPQARRVFDLDRQAAAVRQQREDAVAALRATAAPVAPPDLPPPSAPPTPAVPRPGGGLRPQVFLAAAGAVLLLAAAVVFIAVTWPTWPASVQAAFIAALTVLGAFAARDAARRDLAVTAEAIAVVTMAVAGYSLLAARREGLAGLDALDARLWFSIVGSALAVVARPFTVWARLRDTVRRVGVAVAVAAAGSGLVWLADVVTVEPPRAVVVAAAPAAAVVLLLHTHWVLRRDDWFHHAGRIAPAVLLVVAAVGTGLLSLDATSLVTVTTAAIVGLPALVWLRQARPRDPWTFAGAALGVVWVASFVQFLLADVAGTTLGLPLPRLVTFSVAAVVVGASARLRPPVEHWRLPILLGTAVAVVPAAGATLVTWVDRGDVVERLLAAPFTGWPAGAALTVSDLVLAAMVVVGVGLVVERLQPTLLWTWVGIVGGAAAAVAVVAAAAAGAMPMATPLAVAAVAALAAGTVWERAPERWRAVAVTELAAIGVALVDVELFALATGAVAVHLLWVASLRRSMLTAAAGVAAGLAAVAATSDAIGWATTTTTLLVTLVAGVVLVTSQFARACEPWRATPTDLVVLAAALVATATAAAADAAPATAVQLAIVAVAAAVHAFRPGRGRAVWLSSVAVSGAVWTLLGDRGVEVVEAYTIPAAVALAAAGAWRLHTTDTSSWAACWPACLMASLPTLGVLLEGPDPVRVLLLTAGAVAVALLGHRARLAALLVAGSVVAVVTSLLQLYDWTADLPKWVTFGSLGALLIWTSATYEAQLQRARQLRQRVTGLR